MIVHKKHIDAANEVIKRELRFDGKFTKGEEITAYIRGVKGFAPFGQIVGISFAKLSQKNIKNSLRLTLCCGLKIDGQKNILWQNSNWEYTEQDGNAYFFPQTMIPEPSASVANEIKNEYLMQQERAAA